MSIRRLPVVGVMGSHTDRHGDWAVPLGRRLAEGGVHLLTGAGPGAMEAVAEAFVAVTPRRGLSIGIVPSAAWDSAEQRAGYPNAWVELAIRTHLAPFEPGDPVAKSRNHINVLSSDAIVALPGGQGTQDEVALALRFGRPVVCLGWSAAGLPDMAAPERAAAWAIETAWAGRAPG